MARAIKQQWNGNPLHRNSLRAAEVKKGFLLLLVVSGCLVSLLIGGAVFSYHWLCRSDFFHITAIDVTGNQAISKETVLQLAGVSARANLLAIDLGQVADRLSRYGWIETVALRKEWPSHLRIEIRERRPVALLNTGKGMYYVDAKGQPFAELTGRAEIDLPVISGLEETVSEKNGALHLEDTENLLSVLRFIGFATRGSSSLPAQNISQVQFGDNGEITLFLADRPFPIFLGQELGKKAYNRLAKVLYWLYKKKEFQTVTYIRMDYMEGKVLVGQESGNSNG